MFSTEIRRLSAVLAGALIMWLFAQTLMVSPLVIAVDKLATTIEKSEDRNTVEHKLIVSKLNVHTTRMDKNEVKLFRVIEDCEDNNNDIRTCKAIHIGEQ